MTYQNPRHNGNRFLDGWEDGGFFRRRIVAPLVRWHQRRAEFTALSKLSDDILNDIGLHRGGLREFVDGVSLPGEFVARRPQAPQTRAPDLPMSETPMLDGLMPSNGLIPETRSAEISMPDMPMSDLPMPMPETEAERAIVALRQAA